MWWICERRQPKHKKVNLLNFHGARIFLSLSMKDFDQNGKIKNDKKYLKNLVGDVETGHCILKSFFISFKDI